MTNLVIIKDNQTVTTSRMIAQSFDKQHKDVLKSIENLDCSPEFYKRNFAPIQIASDLGLNRTRQDKAYELTRDGFTFLAMGYTGKKAAEFKEAYIKAFNEMESKLHAETKNLTIEQLIIMQAQSVAELKNEFRELKERVAGQAKLLANPVLDTKNLVSVREYLTEAKLNNLLPFAAKIGLKAKTYSRLNHIQFVKYAGGNFYTAPAIQYGVNAMADIQDVIEFATTPNKYFLPPPSTRKGFRKSEWHKDIFNLEVNECILYPDAKRDAMKQHIGRYRRKNPQGMDFITTGKKTPKGQFAVQRLK